MATIPSIRSSAAGTNSLNSTDTVTTTYPASIEAGDLLICWCHFRSNLNPPTPSASGWTAGLASGNTTLDDWIIPIWKVADGTETGTFDVTMPRSSAASISNGIVVAIQDSACFTGCAIGDWRDAEAENNTAVNDSTLEGIAVTTTANNTLAIGIAAKGTANAGTVTVSNLNGWTEELTMDNGSSSSDFYSKLSYKAMASAGGTSAPVWSSASATDLATTYAILPASRRIFIT